MHGIILIFSALISWIGQKMIKKATNIDNYQFLEQIFFIIVFGIFTIIQNYLIEASLIQNFNYLQNLDNGQNQQKNLLEYLLPFHVKI